MADSNIGALILAAGLSSRMKAFKPLLQIGGKTLIERAIELFESVGIGHIVTVAGHRSDELIPVVSKTTSRWVINHYYHDGMFSSIQQGVHELQGSCDAFFLLPVDIPLVRPRTIHNLQEAFKQEPSTLICYPQFDSRRGHPPLIDSSLIGEILAFDGQGGMRAFLSKYKDQAVTTPVSDKYILLDADTREDLSLLKTAFSSY